MVELKGNGFVLRPWRESDIESLPGIANNKKIARNMMFLFSYPYELKDARAWVELMEEDEQADKNFAIEIDGVPVSGVGFDIKSGIREGSAEGGYWLGEEFWGKGIASEAWNMVRDYAFENFDIRRLGASVFAWNPASMRVLEKCGFDKEGVLKDSILRSGEVCDDFRFGITRGDWEELR